MLVAQHAFEHLLAPFGIGDLAVEHQRIHAAERNLGSQGRLLLHFVQHAFLEPDEREVLAGQQDQHQDQLHRNLQLVLQR